MYFKDFLGFYGFRCIAELLGLLGLLEVLVSWLCWKQAGFRWIVGLAGLARLAGRFGFLVLLEASLDHGVPHARRQDGSADLTNLHYFPVPSFAKFDKQ